MAGTLTPTPYQTVLDGDGAAVSGAKIYTYVAGTTTNAATYTSSALSSANTNPIVADSAGRYVAYLSAGANLRFIIKTSADVLIDDQDNVQSVPGSSVNLDIEGTVGEAVTAGQVVYLSSAAESVPLTAGKWYLTDSDAAATSTAPQSVGVAVSAIAINTAGTIRLAGEVGSAGTVVVGTTYYVGATPGAIVTSAPANSRQVGVGLTTSSLLLAATTAVASTLPNPITQDLLFTDNTYDIGKVAASRPRDGFFTRNAVVGGTLGVTGVATLTAQPILSTLTASRAVFSDGSKGLVSNAITGTGNVVMSASPTLTGTIGAAAATFSGAVTLNGGLNTPLVVAQGGTGVAELTANNLLLGAGTGNVTFAAPGTSGYFLQTQGAGADPVWAEVSSPAVINDSGQLNFESSTELTISSGAITASKNYHTIDTESDAATDDLNTITAGTDVSEGFVLTLQLESTARLPTLKDGTGNISIGRDVSFTAVNQAITLVYDGTNWRIMGGPERGRLSFLQKAVPGGNSYLDCSSFTPTVSRVFAVWNLITIVTDDREMRLNDTGGSWDFTVRAYKRGTAAAHDFTNNGVLGCYTSGNVSGYTQGNAANEFNNGWAYFANDGTKTIVHGKCNYISDTGLVCDSTFYGIKSASSIPGIQYVSESGNIDGGELIVYEVLEE